MREPIIWQYLLYLVPLRRQSGRIIGQRAAAKSHQHHSGDKKAPDLDETASPVRIVPEPLPATRHLAAFPPFAPSPDWRAREA